MSKTSDRSAVNAAVSILMDILVGVAILCVVNLVVAFFGTMSGTQWGRSVLAFTKLMVLPFGIDAMRTPYQGIFDANVAATVLLLMAIEWTLGLVRRNV